jgi:drug/metabolite transporter (DMT)-like permease
MKGRFGESSTAYLLSLLNCFIFFSATLTLKRMNYLTFCQALTLRSSVGILLSYGFTSAKGGVSEVTNPGDFRKVLLRSLLLTLNSVMLFFMLKELKASVTLTLNCTGPMYTYLINFLVYGVRTNRKCLLGVAFSFLGVFLIINRDSLSPTTVHVSPYELTYILIFSLTQVLWAFGVLQVNFLTPATNSLQVSVNYAFVLLFVSVLLTVLSPGPPVQLDLWQFFVSLILVGLPLGISHNLYTLVTMLTKKVGSVSMFNYLGVVFGYLTEMVLDGEPPNLVALSGSLLTALGLYLIVLN